MAKCTITDNEIKQGEIISICDPCCDGSGLAIATLDVLKNDYKVNFAMDFLKNVPTLIFAVFT